jgi:hypothetical protein
LNWSTVLSLASVLYKSYFRANSRRGRSFWSKPIALVILDVVVFIAPFVLLSWALPLIPSEFSSTIHQVALQAIIVLPILLTAGVILAGVLFELGQTTSLSTSEAVNWLPVSPNEYIMASSTSLEFAYSPLLCFTLGAVIPLSLSLGVLWVIPFFILISILAFIWGAVLVEALRAVMNRLSTSLYKKSGRSGVILRIVLVVVLIVAVQIAFNPYILYVAMSSIVAGVNLAWFVPVIWPSVAVASSLVPDATRTIAFTLLSLIFTLLIFVGAAKLRTRYWSPVPVVITVSTSTVYVPTGRSFGWLDPTAFALALKELRSLVRRKDMARFLAIPVVFVVASFLPAIEAGANASTALSAVRFVVLVESSFIVPMLLSSICVGQEGRSIANIYMLPISVDEFMNGKLFLSWVISTIGILVVVLLLQFVAPIAPLLLLASLVTAIFNILIQSYVGLALGSRYPNFTTGPRARYITITGFILDFIIGGIATLGTFAPLLVYLATGFSSPVGGGSNGSILLTMVFTAAIGTIILLLMRSYCIRGVKNFLSDMES